MDYFSLDFLLKNEVIIPSLIVVLIAVGTQVAQDKANHDENFLMLKFKFNELWSSMAIDEDLLNSNYQDRNKKDRYKAFQMIEFFNIVWFVHINKKTRYSKEWEHNIAHVFKYPLIQSAFEEIVVQKRTSYNYKWIDFGNNLIEQNGKKTSLSLKTKQKVA